jgi:hypothetical protein
MSRCPHFLAHDICPADCRFAACTRPTHEVCTDFEILLNPDLDYEAARKEICRFCRFFLTQGERN